ncbi:Melibiose/raffinose/stachyose import permease protein MelD [Paenibacillus allorhizoplanae]|uniref:Melibiose/raffinose/stachyose import permease protein MelD n=1 Tax=Paenibacillus allorhizoplanae TaxID=2905648 RepID=A0ABN8GYX1_9BACL|nr:sugar ABC transporter permease [Paenibacillus allorhizoplanae]CAH1222609.1 Melibiose/raffinose/stachyose import permease protein MelD [Paenibacillus allorhizoplanae]
MRKQGWWGFCFTLPFLIQLAVFFLFPFFFSFYLTFTKWDLFNAPHWIGLRNWSLMVKNDVFWLALRNVFCFALLFVPGQTLVSLLLAYMLNLQIRGKTFFRLIYFLPVITPWVAGGLVWLWIYNNEFGILNWMLDSLGLDRVNWVRSEKWWLVIGSIAIVNIWKGAGYSMVLLLAGMQNISKEIMEAARIDGANGWKYFTKITIPLVSPMVYMVMILSTISAFHAFDVFLVMLGEKGDINSIHDRNMVPNILIYRDAFLNAKMGAASAWAWGLFAIILLVTLFQKKMEKRWVHYE